MNSVEMEMQCEESSFPAEASMVCSALETGQHVATERRARRRRQCRAEATLRLFSDTPGSEATVLYVRDTDSRGLGFVTKRRLPLGHGGVIALRAPDGREMQLNGTFIRCRAAAPGWYEGAFSFNRDQPDFAA